MKIEQYALEQSALFRVRSIHQLAKVLLVEVDDLHDLERSVKDDQRRHYRVFSVNDGKREVQHPFEPRLGRIQKRVKCLLSQIKPPDYVLSGRKGKSYVDNAKVHADSTIVWTMDIKGFYKNTRDEAVFQFFLHKLGMSSDLAHLMTNLCTFGDEKTGRRKIPTGSTLSQQLAFWAYSDMFDRIHTLATVHDAKFSLYVDDMTFSTNSRLPDDFHKSVQEILAARWLRFKPSKLVRATENETKRITGCEITPAHIVVVPNRLKKKTVDAIKKVLCSKLPTDLEVLQALGLIQSARQIDPSAFEASLQQVKAKRRAIAIQATTDE